MKRREAKSKGEEERYKHLSAELQRIPRRDKKAFLSDQCKETEENNRIEKTRMAPHSSTLAWKIPWMEELGRLQSMGWTCEELDMTEWLHFHALEKEMATHYSVRAWRIPGTGEPGGLPSMQSQRVRHDWSDLAAPAAEISSRKLEIPREHLMQRWAQ